MKTLCEKKNVMRTYFVNLYIISFKEVACIEKFKMKMFLISKFHFC